MLKYPEMTRQQRIEERRVAEAKRAKRYGYVALILLVAGFSNVGAAFATENRAFSVAAGSFFVASIFYVVMSWKMKPKDPL